MDLTSIPIEGTLLTALSATETTPLTFSPDMIREVKCNLDMTYFCTKGTMIPHRYRAGGSLMPHPIIFKSYPKPRPQCGTLSDVC